MIGITLRGATSGDFSTLADTPKWGRVEAVFGGRWGSCAKRLLARPPGWGIPVVVPFPYGLGPEQLAPKTTPEYTLAAPQVKSIPCFTKEETP